MSVLKPILGMLGKALMRIGVAMAGKEMAIWLARTYVKTTDNTVDDATVDLFAAGLNNASPEELRELAKRVGEEALDAWDAR